IAVRASLVGAGCTETTGEALLRASTQRTCGFWPSSASTLKGGRRTKGPGLRDGLCRLASVISATVRITRVLRTQALRSGLDELFQFCFSVGIAEPQLALSVLPSSRKL